MALPVRAERALTSRPRLILVNGPQGIGKSTLAHRYVDEHPLVLNLDIDAVRTSLGQWPVMEESKTLARMLATAMIRVHLGSGHDVVVPQLLQRAGFIEELDALAAEVGAEFVELLILDSKEGSVERFRQRRDALDVARHPQEEIDPSEDAKVIAETHDALLRIVQLRPNTQVIDTTAGQIDEAFAALCRAVDG